MTAALQRQPLTAEHLRAANRIALASASEVLAIFGKLAARLQASLATFTTAPLRISLDGLEETDAAMPPDGLRLTAASRCGPLEAWISCDRNFIVGLAELSFGGTGKEPPADGPDRPSSTLESRLRQAVLRDLADALPAILGEELELAVSLTAIEATPAGTAAQPIAALAGVLLFTAFGNSGEIRIHFPRDQFAKVMRARALPQAGHEGEARAIARQMQQTTIALAFTLPAQTIALSELGGLRPGHTIRLSNRPDDPVLVTSAGVELFKAGFAATGNRIAFVLHERSSGGATA